MIKQFYLIYRCDPNRYYLGVMVMKVYSTFPKLEDWSRTIRYSLMSYPGH